jgi:hypothetical protein
MTTSLLFKKISTIFIAVLVCFVMFAMPEKVDAKEYIFGSLFEHIAFKVGASGEFTSENIITDASGRQRIEDSDFIWETSRNTAGYDDSNWLGNETFDAKITRSDELTYYGALENNTGMTDEQEKTNTRQFFSDLGNALEEYAVASRFGSNSMPQVTDGTLVEENYRSYRVTDVAALKRESEAVLAVMAILERDPDLKNVGYQENGITAPQLNTIASMKAAKEKATQLLTLIAEGKIQPGRTIQAHEEGNLTDSGTAGAAIKVFDEQGNEVARAAATPVSGSNIFCWHGLPSPAIDPQGCIALGLYYGLLKPSSWVLWASGVAFNYGIDLTLNFGKFLRDQGLSGTGNEKSPGAIYLGWAAIRDLINVGFIFILLYAGISTILGLDGYGVKQTIVKVVIAALLINFSLFFTKALIDMSNLIALQFYTRVLAAADQASYGANFVGPKQDSWDQGLSIGFVNALGLKSIWTSKDNQSGNQAGSAFGGINAGQLIIICLGGSAFILVTAFTLFMATIRFLYRSIVLIFLMILSPIGFIGEAIPPLKGAASKWQSRLKNNLMFAPAYMAIFYVVSLIVFGKGIGPDQTAANSGTGLTGFGALFQGDVSSTGLLFWFVLIIGLMLGTQMAADSFADKLSIADSFKKKAKGWAAGAAAMPTRRVLGGTADALIKNTAVKAVLARVPGGGIVMSGLDKVRSSKMFGAASYKDNMKAAQATTEGRAKLFKEGRELTQYKGEDDKDFDARKKKVKQRATNAASSYLGMGGPLGLVGKGEVKKEDLKESGKVNKIVQATRYIPLIGSSLEKLRRKNQAARKTIFEGDREEKDKKLKTDIESKLEIAENDLAIYDSAAAYKTQTEGLENSVTRLKQVFAASTAANLATNRTALQTAQKALAKHIKEEKDLRKQIEKFKEDLSRIDSRKKDSK